MINNNNNNHRFSTAILTAFIGTLFGCEAALNLDGVARTEAQDIRRTDQFQAIANSEKSIVVVGSGGVVLRKPLDGDSWQRIELAEAESLVDVALCPDGRFVALSMSKNVWQSEDEGTTWKSFPITTEEDVLDLTCAPDNSVWVVGSFSTITHAKDLAGEWASESLFEDAMLTNIQFINNDEVIIAGEFGFFARSNDGGASWQPPAYIPNEFYVHGMLFSDLENGWVSGLAGQIYATEDGGVSWSLSETPTASPLYGLYQNGGELYAFGDHATVLKYDSPSWSKIKNPNPPVYIRDALLLPNGSLLMAGGSGSLYELDGTAKNIDLAGK